MTRLLHAGFYRLKKNKVLGGCLLAIITYELFVLLSQYRSMIKEGYEYTLDPLYFNFLALIGILTSILVSLFIGTDYHDGTIRNKLICGASRTSVYLSNFIMMASCGIFCVLTGYAVALGLGLPLFGSFEMPVSAVLALSLISILFTLAYVSIFHMVSMTCSSKTTSAVCCILLAFALLFIASMLLSSLAQPEYIEQLSASSMKAGQIVTTEDAVLETVKNPAYLSGVKREIYQNIMDFLPSGQMVQLLNGGDIHIFRAAFYSIFIIVGTNMIGLRIFKKKDIK